MDVVGKPKLLRLSAGFLFVAISLLMAIATYLHPEYNWDIIPYIGSVYSIDIHNPQLVHADTYAIVKETLPPNTFNKLISGNSYQSTVCANYHSFEQQLPFYTVKPLYILLVYVLSQIGLNIVHATVLVSTLSYLLICLTIFLWIYKQEKHTFLFLISTLFIMSPPVIEIAKYSTPDALSTSIVGLAMYIISMTRIKILGEVLLLVSMLARPDNVIFVVILLMYFVFLSPKRLNIRKTGYVLGAILAVVIYMLIGRVAHGYSYLVLFEHTFVHLLDEPADYNGHVTLGEYLFVLVRGSYGLTGTMVFPFAIMSMLVIYLSRLTVTYSEVKESTDLILLNFLILLLHFVIFPLPDDRLFTVEYTVIMLSMIRILSKVLIRVSSSGVNLALHN